MIRYYNKLNDIIFYKENNIFKKFNTNFNNQLFHNNNRKNTILILCIFSSLIYYYYRGEDIKKLCINWNIKKYEIRQEQNTIYGIFYYADNIIISFKGTSSLNDIINDLTLCEIDDSYQIPGLIHKGFHDLILGNKLCEKIFESILDIIDSNNVKNIYLTGHSMGGSLSAIFYSFLKSKLIYNLKLITFGCPKIGNKAFADYISNEDNIRIVNGNDLISKIPKSLFYLINYTHPKKTLLTIGKKDTYFFSVDDHSIDNYYNAIVNNKNI